MNVSAQLRVAQSQLRQPTLQILSTEGIPGSSWPAPLTRHPCDITQPGEPPLFSTWCSSCVVELVIGSKSNNRGNDGQELTGAGEEADPPRLLEAMRKQMVAHHYSPRTQDAYVGWTKRFVRFSGAMNWSDLGSLSEKDVTAFLTHLAEVDRVAPSTQNQARAALVFLFGTVLQKGPLPEVFVRNRAPRRLPTALTREEILALLNQLQGPQRLMASLLYGSGLRLIECCRLRIKDVDLSARQLFVRRGQNGRDRLVPLPRSKVGEVARQIEVVRELHTIDLERKAGWVQLPEEARHDPCRGRAFPWQWLFPSGRLHRDACSGQIRRHHLHETSLQKALSKAARGAQLDQPATCHTLRHSFASHLLEAGVELSTVQELLGHRKVSSAMIYVPVLRAQGKSIRSPLDFLTEPSSVKGESGFSDVARRDWRSKGPDRNRILSRGTNIVTHLSQRRLDLQHHA